MIELPNNLTKVQAIEASSPRNIRQLSKPQLIQCIETLEGFRLTPAEQRHSITRLRLRLQLSLPSW